MPPVGSRTSWPPPTHGSSSSTPRSTASSAAASRAGWRRPPATSCSTPTPTCRSTWSSWTGPVASCGSMRPTSSAPTGTTDPGREESRRAVYSWVYNWLIQLAFDTRIRDVNFACKLIRRPVLEQVHLVSEGSFIDAELIVRAQRLGFHVVQIGVDYFPRSRGTSTLSSISVIRTIVRELVSLRRELRALTPPAQ